MAVYPYFIYLTLRSFFLHILTLVHSPFSFLIFLSLLSTNDSWALTAFYISFFSATVREWLGIRGLVKTNKRPCGSPRVATSHNKPPTPCRRRHTVHRARLCSKCHSGFHDNQTATLAMEKCRVMVDGDLCTEPPGWTVWRVRWSCNSKHVKYCKKSWQGKYRTNEKQKGGNVWLKQSIFMIWVSWLSQFKYCASAMWTHYVALHLTDSGYVDSRSHATFTLHWS